MKNDTRAMRQVPRKVTNSFIVQHSKGRGILKISSLKMPRDHILVLLVKNNNLKVFESKIPKRCSHCEV